MEDDGYAALVAGLDQLRATLGELVGVAAAVRSEAIVRGIGQAGADAIAATTFQHLAAVMFAGPPGGS